MRTAEEITGQLQSLRHISKKPTFRKTTISGDSNIDAINAQIETLERKFSVETVDNRTGEEWEEHVASSARDAALWLSEESEDDPADGWEGLH